MAVAISGATLRDLELSVAQQARSATVLPTMRRAIGRRRRTSRARPTRSAWVTATVIGSSAPAARSAPTAASIVRAGAQHVVDDERHAVPRRRR